ncbi:hypothetical protein K1719_044949 [Acacia pycnantha]|nr:hypothetical protein K1719_044949 [Acacia pycnantha]
MESSSMVVPLSLTHLEVKCCHGLTTLMMSSTAPSLVHITHLSISDCDQIEEIITKQEGEDDEDKEIFFNKMKFWNLIKCPQFTLFCPRAIHAPQLQSVQVEHSEIYLDEALKHIWMTDLNNTIQHLFTFEEVISTTHIMTRNGKNITRIVDVFPKMEEIVMNDTNEDVQGGITFNRLYSIKLTDMPSLKMFSPQSHTFEFPDPGVLKTPKLSKVKIEEHGMEWKGYPQQRIALIYRRISSSSMLSSSGLLIS